MRKIEAETELWHFWQAQHGPGAITVAECSTCGYQQWTSTAPKADDAVVVYRWEQLNFSSPCPRCAEVKARAPEVFLWVQACMAQAQTKGPGN